MDTGFWSLIPVFALIVAVIGLVVMLIGPENIRRSIRTFCSYLTRRLISWVRYIRLFSACTVPFLRALFTERSVFGENTLVKELEQGKDIVSPLIEFLEEKRHFQATTFGVGGWMIQSC